VGDLGVTNFCWSNICASKRFLTAEGCMWFDFAYGYNKLKYPTIKKTSEVFPTLRVKNSLLFGHENVYIYNINMLVTLKIIKCEEETN